MTAPRFAADLRRLLHGLRVQAIALIDMIQAYRLRRPPPPEWGTQADLGRMSRAARDAAVVRLTQALARTLTNYRLFKLALRAADRRMPA